MLNALANETVLSFLDEWRSAMVIAKKVAAAASISEACTMGSVLDMWSARTLAAVARLIFSDVSEAKATILRSAPSISLMFVLRLCATYSRTFSGMSLFIERAFFLQMFSLVS